MSSDPARSPSRTPSPLLPPLTALGEVPSPDSESDGEVKQDQLAFTLESPSCPQLQLFETVFNTGKPLSGYCQDDLLWLLLAEVASPCTNCSKTPASGRSFDIGISLIAVIKILHTAIGSWSSTKLPHINQRGVFRLAAVAEAHSGLVQQGVSSPPARTPIKGAGQDLLSSKMPPTPHPTLVPRTLAAHPYRAENQRLAAWLRISSREFLQHQAEYRCIIDQFNTLDRALSGPPGQSLPERFQKVEEELRIAKKDWDDATGKLSTSSRKVSELTTALLYQHGIADEANALATRQRVHLEELQEEVHRTRGRAAFVEWMIKEYPDKGYYKAVLPPLSQLEGDLVKVQADLRRVATLAHRLYRSDPATVLHHHNHYIGAIIEAVIAFLRRALDSEDPDVVVHNFRLALDYMQLVRGIHGDLHMRSISSIQWFFNNTVDQDEGLYNLMLEHSRFDSDGPFLTAAQHAGSANPPPNSLEPVTKRQRRSD
ncbi:hypothetical protein EV359DRAFT_85970 [Lentinula novae-zelandiae]|nr:hypothetical protein EV359DRAFT_85970 [Lentinula novae-zelandiae]